MLLLHHMDEEMEARKGKQIVKVRHLVSGGPEYLEPELSNHQDRMYSFIHSLIGCSRCVGQW